MDFSFEWTDWHLTPEGWIKGNYKTDFCDTFHADPPPNRVLTRRHIESISSIYEPLKITNKNIWASKNIREIKRLYRLFPFPNSLAVNNYSRV